MSEAPRTALDGGLWRGSAGSKSTGASWRMNTKSPTSTAVYVYYPAVAISAVDQMRSMPKGIDVRCCRAQEFLAATCMEGLHDVFGGVRHRETPTRALSRQGCVVVHESWISRWIGIFTLSLHNNGRTI